MEKIDWKKIYSYFLKKTGFKKIFISFYAFAGTPYQYRCIPTICGINNVSNVIEFRCKQEINAFALIYSLRCKPKEFSNEEVCKHIFNYLENNDLYVPFSNVCFHRGLDPWTFIVETELGK